MAIDTSAAIAANRFGLGARPGELARIGNARDWLKAQLRGGAPLLTDASLKSTAAIMAGAAELAEERQEVRRDTRRDARRDAASDAPAAGASAAGAADNNMSDDEAAQRARQQLVANRLPRYYRPIYVSEVQARLRHAVQSERPFIERLVHFWSNHFAVSIDKIATLGLAGAMEREAIRPNVLGKFADLLRSVEQHPAMLLYLDNQQSIGPNSRFASLAAQRRNRELGLNENLAREILELHTLGVDGGYTQADVTSFARVITGWSVNGARGALRQADGAPGEFAFREQVHEPGAHMVLGKRYPQAGVAQGEAVLRDLAAAPATAKFVATKLARHFIADDPPASAVERLTRAFQSSGGDLPTVYAALVDSPEAWSTATSKYKTPQDYVHSIYRGLAVPVPAGQQALNSLELLGQRSFSPGSPAGWPDRSADWDGAAALMKRIEFSDALAQRLGNSRNADTLAPELLGGALSAETRESIARAASGAQALTLLLTSPEFLRR